MARARNVKPGFFKNEILVELPMSTRLLFIGLWTLADREGRLEYRPKKIKMEIFPADEIDIEAGIQELAAQGFLIIYDSIMTQSSSNHDSIMEQASPKQEAKFIQIVNWTKHQTPHYKETTSVIPAFDPSIIHDQVNHESIMTHDQVNQNAPCPSDSLIPDSLIPDTQTSDSDAQASVSVNSQKPEISNENKSLAQTGKDYLVSLNHPNFSSPQWVSGYLSVQFDELERSRPDIPKQEILRMWRDTCDLAVEKNKSAQQWSKSTFKNKLDSWKPAIQTKTVSTPVQYKNHRERLMAAKKIRNIFDGNDVEPSTLRMGNGLIYDQDGRVFPDEEYKVIEDGS